ncbi:hypothetical protein BCU70_21380 [Vibrio sp. 10N.286.49.C2]|uniref:sugar transferase n=1 Tax=unclassified Vibrio TaxID=2614977 RepID=UPI000C8257B5|nr:MULTISPECIES: sugar transferase [unclassified Vibrio]PMH32133.1 hypothetical protein BCU70_21380 [Vibrio sp. 10N.286.49.C2]PMH47972.1 hypothetical protein BCU66_21725 [Vibrio sp. 10N.286.49.B1]
MSSIISPVVLFVYNRPIHASKTIKALAENYLSSSTKLYIFSDGAKNDTDIDNVINVRDMLLGNNDLDVFESVNITESKCNLGLAESIKNGVSDILKVHDRVIVLEDDLITSNDYLNFMNDALEYYCEDESIGSISGYSPLAEIESYEFDVYKAIRTSSLGWATWDKVWKDVDWNKPKVANIVQDVNSSFNSCGTDRWFRLYRQIVDDANSWSIIFGYDQFKKGRNTIYSTKTRVINIGDDGSGVHDSSKAVYNTNMVKESRYQLIDVMNNTNIDEQLMKHFSGGRVRSFIRSIRCNILSFKHKYFGTK